MSLPQSIAQALVPFAPPTSKVHEDAHTEEARVKADLAYNELKNSGELLRYEARRAFLLQQQYESLS